jgi:protein gp37
MAENTKIEWCDHTVNFWWGCTKVSSACVNCYAERMDAHFHPGLPWKDRFQGEKAMASHWGTDAPRLIRDPAAHNEAVRYERRATREGRRFRVFTNSMSDFFEDRGDLDGARIEALETMRRTPHLDWLILTKRPERITALLRRISKSGALASWVPAWLDGLMVPPNIWIGTTVEDQERADQRIPALLQVPAIIRFLSCEPLLGPVDLRLQDCWLGYTPTRDLLHQVIGGGESGPGARPSHPDWFRGLRDQCAAAGMPFLFKQNGEWIPIDQPWEQDSPSRLAPNERWLNQAGGHGFHGQEVWRMRRVGKAKAGRLLDGIEHNGYPEVH